MAFVGKYGKKNDAAYYRIKIVKASEHYPNVRAEFQIFADAAQAAAAKTDDKIEPLSSQPFHFLAPVEEADKKKAGYLAAKAIRLFSGLSDA